jgi:hypothetical protein
MARLVTWSMFVAFSTVLAAAGSAASIGVFMDFDSAPAPALVKIMQEEVTGLLRNSGVSLNWRILRENHGDQPFARLVVLKFTGSCRAPWSTPPLGDFGTAGEVNALGSSQVQRGEVLPYGQVSCDAIRQTLAYLAAGSTHAARQKALGLAMGRVVAHELYHMLANRTKHAALGLAKAAHSVEDLFSPNDLGFTEADSRAIADGVK